MITTAYERTWQRHNIGSERANLGLSGIICGMVGIHSRDLVTLGAHLVFGSTDPAETILTLTPKHSGQEEVIECFETTEPMHSQNPLLSH